MRDAKPSAAAQASRKPRAGESKGGAPKTGARAAGKAGPADSKLKAALEAKAAADARAKESNKVQAALRAELKKLKAAAAESPPSAADAAMELDHDGTEPSNSVLEAAIAAAKDELKQTQGLSDFQKSLVPGFAATLAAAQAKLEAAMVARRAASPLKKQLEGAEGHQLRSAKKVADATVSLESRRKELEKAQEAVTLQEQNLAGCCFLLQVSCQSIPACSHPL